MNKTIAAIALAAGLAGTGAAIKVSNAPVEKEVTVLQINAKWNRFNTREDLQDLDGCEYKFAWLEDQSEELKATIKTVPVVVIYDEGRPAYQYSADISLKLKTPFNDIQDQVWRELDD